MHGGRETTAALRWAALQASIVHLQTHSAKAGRALGCKGQSHFCVILFALDHVYKQEVLLRFRNRVSELWPALPNKRCLRDVLRYALPVDSPEVCAEERATQAHPTYPLLLPAH